MVEPVLEKIYEEFKDRFELRPEAVEVRFIDVSPLYAQTFIDILDGETKESFMILPASAYFNYPFKRASNILEYVACRIKQDWDLCGALEEIDERQLSHDGYEFLLKLLGAYLGYRYVYYLDEGGSGEFDKIILFNTEETKNAVEKILGVMERLEPELEKLEDQDDMAELIAKNL